MAIASEKPRIYEGTRIPSPVPTILPVPEELRGSEDLLQVNFGPNHPSTHGVLRLIVDLHGEQVVGLEAVIGYLHTGFEKNMEQKTWWKAITYPERMDYLAFQANEYAFVAACEKLLELETPQKAVWMRTLMLELSRIHSHLIWLGTGALELGAIGLLWYTFNAREQVLDLSELVGGVRMHTRYFQAGGLAEDIPPGFFPECWKFCEFMPKAIDEYDALLTSQEIHTSMESLIHHFKMVTEGYRVPEGEVYVATETARGEFGCYVVSDGGPKPWRVKFRAPSFVALEATATCMSNALVADLIAIV